MDTQIRLRRPNKANKAKKCFSTGLKIALIISLYSLKGTPRKKDNFTTRTPMLSKENKAFLTKTRLL